MNQEIIFSILGIIILIIVITATLKTSNKNKIRTKENKKADIINQYKKRLRHELKLLNGNKEAIKNRKTELLKEFNMELSRNIFFDKNEIRAVLLDLARH